MRETVRSRVRQAHARFLRRAWPNPKASSHPADQCVSVRPRDVPGAARRAVVLSAALPSCLLPAWANLRSGRHLLTQLQRHVIAADAVEK